MKFKLPNLFEYSEVFHKIVPLEKNCNTELNKNLKHNF